MTNDKAARIAGTITLPDGQVVQFSITQEDGYQQWGADRPVLGRTQPIVDSMTTALQEDHLLDGPNEDDWNPGDPYVGRVSAIDGVPTGSHFGYPGSTPETALDRKIQEEGR